MQAFVTPGVGTNIAAASINSNLGLASRAAVAVLGGAWLILPQLR